MTSACVTDRRGPLDANQFLTGHRPRLGVSRSNLARAAGGGERGEPLAATLTVVADAVDHQPVALAGVAATVASRSGQQEVVEAKAKVREQDATDGYRLTDHVKRYYETIRV